MSDVKMTKLYMPALDDIVKVLQKELTNDFENVEVDVVDCPDLRAEPFTLSAQGLGGKPRIADVGGVPNLVPLVQRNKIYDLKDVAKKSEIPDAFIIGPGAGPWHEIGTNSEMMANLKCGEVDINNTYIAKMCEDGTHNLSKIGQSTNFALMGNFFLSEGKLGKVLKVSAKKRKSSKDFVEAMRDILKNRYGDEPVGVGGVFLIKSGKAKLHIMPDFSTTPLKSDKDVDNWLRFFNMNAPLVCLSVFVSHDPGLDLRVEHTHCFSSHGEGGHYHIDTTPDDVEYIGYFNIAEYLYRIDAPVNDN